MKFQFKQAAVVLLLGVMIGAAGVIAFAQTDAGRTTQLGQQVANVLPFLPTSTPDWIVQWNDQPTTVAAERGAGKQVFLPAYLPRNMMLSRIDRMVPERWNGPPPQHSLRLSFVGIGTPGQADMNQFAIFQEENTPYADMAEVGTFIDPRKVVTRTLVQGNTAVVYRNSSSSENQQTSDNSSYSLAFRIGEHTFTMFGNIGSEQMLKVAESLSPALVEVQRGTGDIAPTPKPGR